MAILEITAGLLGVAVEMLGLHASFTRAARDRRERAALYFADLAALVQQTSDQLRRNVYPHGSCAEMERLALLMPLTLQGLLTAEQIECYRDRLLSVHEIERAFGELQAMTPAQGGELLAQLDHAAGTFRALATHLRTASRG